MCSLISWSISNSMVSQSYFLIKLIVKLLLTNIIKTLAQRWPLKNGNIALLQVKRTIGIASSTFSTYCNSLPEPVRKPWTPNRSREAHLWLWPNIITPCNKSWFRVNISRCFKMSFSRIFALQFEKHTVNNDLKLYLS